jgi:DUF4097 and DUF4098 domain-containing protein YvlB
MKRRTSISLAVVVAMSTIPAAAPAQSIERSIERWAESIAASAERIAAQVERRANTLAARIEREFQERERREGRRSRIHERDIESHDRELPFQTTRLDTTFAFATNGIVDLSTLYGDIVVSGWERREARVRAVTERGRIEYDVSSSRLTIEHRNDRGSTRSRSEDTRYELTVPRGARLVLRTTSGDVEVRGTGAEVEVNTNNGDVTLEDVGERVEVGTISGDITLRRVKGDLEATTVNGSVDATDVEGDIRLGSTSGDLTVMGARARNVELSTTSGEVSYSGAIDANGRYEFHSHSGTIDLNIPAATNARFSVETFNGEIDSDFPITLMPGDRTSSRPRRFEFSVGTGGPRIIAESFSGDVEIRKR